MKTKKLFLALLTGGVLASSGAAVADNIADDVKTYQGAIDTAVSCKEKYEPYWTDLKEDRKGPPEDIKAFTNMCVVPLEKAFATFVQSVPHKTVADIEQALGERYIGRYLLAQVGKAHAVAGQTNAEPGRLPKNTTGDLLLAVQAHEERDLLLKINNAYPMNESPAGAPSGEAPQTPEEKRLAETQTSPAELYSQLNKIVDDRLSGSSVGNIDSYHMMEGAMRAITHQKPEQLKSRVNFQHNAYPLPLAHGATPSSVFFFEVESEQLDRAQQRMIAELNPMLVRTDLVNALKKQQKTLALNCGVTEAFIFVPTDLHKGLHNGYLYNDPQKGKMITVVSNPGKPDDAINNRPIIVKPQKMDPKGVDSYDWLLYVTVSAKDSTRDNQFNLQQGRRLQAVFHESWNRWSKTIEDKPGGPRREGWEYNHADMEQGFEPLVCFPREAYSDFGDKNLIMYYGVPLAK